MIESEEILFQILCVVNMFVIEHLLICRYVVTHGCVKLYAPIRD